jgi:polar amino acid transport system substrate-binding protein
VQPRSPSPSFPRKRESRDAKSRRLPWVPAFAGTTQKTRYYLCALVAALLICPAANARSLAAIKDSGTITVCAHPNALPFASKDGKRHGFQVELAEAVAKELGVSLTREWVITRYDLFRANCDIVMDSIADRAAQADSGLQLSRPYRRGGVVLAVRDGERTVRSLGELTGTRRVGVLASSVAAMTLNERGVDTVPGLFEDEILGMLSRREIDAAAVTPTSLGYYNLRHPHQKVRAIDAFAGEPDLVWNVAVGMRRPDPTLQQAIDAAITHLIDDGTVKRVYARYGIAVEPPQ